MHRKIFHITFALLACLTTTQHHTQAAELVRLSPANYDEFAPAGKETDAIYGDWVLRNEHIIAVIADALPTRKANMTTGSVGGCIIDLTVRKQPNDLLGAFYPALGRQLKLSEIHADGQLLFDANKENQQPPNTDKPISAKQFTLIYQATAQKNKPDVIVTYNLEENWSQTLRIKTTYLNPHKQPIDIGAKDKIRADVGFEFGYDQPLNLFWAYDSWWQQAYGIITEGAKPLLNSEKLKKQPPRYGTEWAYQFPNHPDGKLKPGESVSIIRSLFPSKDSLGVKLAARTRATKSSIIATVKAVDKNGPIVDARVDMLIGGENYASGRTSGDGDISLSAPGDGKCKVRITPPGRAAVEHALDLAAIRKIGQTIELPIPGTVVANITDADGNPIPCKVGFYGKDGTPDPMFGPDTKIYGIKNLRYTPDGKFLLHIQPGTYEVFISHGSEFDAVIREIKIASGEELKLEAQLRRTVNTAGWLSAELHSHSSPSGDNTSSQRGRVLNLLAEHLEFIPCTEHNRIDTYDFHLEFFKATQRVITCAGMELTGRLLPINHQNAFPLIHHPRTQDGGGPHTDDDPEVQIERLALWDNNSDKIVQSDHPNLVQMFGDRDMNGTSDAGFRKMFGFMDVVEIHPLEKIFSQPTALTTTSNDRGNAIFHWMQLLNLGYRITGVVNTDAHYNFHGSGPLRNYIKSSTDNPAEAKVLDLCHAAEQGTLTMTNGPFMEVFAAGSITHSYRVTPGRDINTDGQLILTIGVQCPNWLDINRVQVFVNGKPDDKLNFTRKSHPQMFADGVTKFNESIQVSLTQDAHLIVAAAGEGLQLGRVMGPAAGKAMPITVSNPIFVDVDGNGFQHNNDMLGLPLPTQKEK